jgi:putative heme-binding domain-containing protein
LLKQLGAQTNPLGRLAASEVLRRSRLTDAQALRALKAIRGDALIAPSVMVAAFQESTSLEATTELLDYLAELMRGGWRPTGQELDSMLGRLPATARARAGGLRAFQGRDEQAGAKLARFEPLLEGGNAEGGRAVFFGSKVACATCHSIGNAGGNVGPDLTKVGAIRSGRDILESVLLPNASFAQGFESYRVMTTGGEEFNGIIARQTVDTVVLRGASGSDAHLWRKQIQEMSRSAISIMPEGLEQAMTQEEFRDLLAFLQALK